MARAESTGTAAQPARPSWPGTEIVNRRHKSAVVEMDGMRMPRKLTSHAVDVGLGQHGTECLRDLVRANVLRFPLRYAKESGEHRANKIPTCVKLP